MTNASYRALNFVDRSIATHELAALRDLGLAAQAGERRAARYVLPESLALGAQHDDRVAAVVGTLGPELGRVYSELLFRHRARVGDLIAALGTSRPTLVARLKVLVANGLAERRGASPKDPTAYYVPKL
jgi:DNA-binding IclR family transcriptional regulator